MTVRAAAAARRADRLQRDLSRVVDPSTRTFDHPEHTFGAIRTQYRNNTTATT